MDKLYPQDYAPYARSAAADTSPPPPHWLTTRLSNGWCRKLSQGLAGRLELLFPDRLGGEMERFYAPDVPNPILLDYGCGGTSFLDPARERGWQTVGADFSPAVVEQVRASGHAGFLVDEELDEGVDDATIARVRMNHVLEHLRDPRSALMQIRRKMAPGGRLHIATPNPASCGSVVFRTRWFSLDCPRHLVLYSPRIVCNLLHEAGFRQTRVIHQVVSKDLIRSWGYVLHDLGRIRHSEIAALRTDEARVELMRVPAKLAAVLSVSDRFHVFADA